MRAKFVCTNLIGVNLSLGCQRDSRPHISKQVLSIDFDSVRTDILVRYAKQESLSSGKYYFQSFTDYNWLKPEDALGGFPAHDFGRGLGFFVCVEEEETSPNQASIAKVLG